MKNRVAEFERRAVRAEELARTTAAASEPLLFAAALYREQAKLSAALATLALCGRLEDDAEALAAAAAPLLAFLSHQGPPNLRGATADAAKLIACMQGEYDFVARAILRPYLEVVALAASHGDLGRCPRCGGAPWISARRHAPYADGYGAERVLYCARCGGEWIGERVLCIACKEGDPMKLPSFSVDQFPGVRIEACETCHAYLKSIDLTLDARPVPEVDDLASIALDLWAIEHGYHRLELGLAGI